jgi:DNA primase
MSGPLIVTEGIPDGLVAVSAGFRTASVISAASAVHPDVAAALADVAGRDGVILAFDRDRAGTDAQEGLAKLLAERGARCQLLQLPNGHDLTDTYTRGRTAQAPVSDVPAAGR